MKIKLMIFPKNEPFSWVDIEYIEEMLRELFKVEKDKLFLKDNTGVLYEVYPYQKSIVLELKKDGENDRSARVLSKVASEIEKGEHRKNHNIIYLWDDVSKYYSKELFLLLSHYERKLREIIYFTLIQALEYQWYQQTFTEDLDKKIKERNNNIKVIENSLEEFTFYEYKEYLFKESWPYNMEKRIDELKEMIQSEQPDKEEIVKTIEYIEKKSLWERYFDSEIEFNLEGSLGRVRKIRNTVMHHKKITYSDFKEYRQVLDMSNLELDDAIDKLYSDNYKKIPLKELSNFVASILEMSKISNKATMSSLENISRIVDSYIETNVKIAKLCQLESIEHNFFYNLSNNTQNCENKDHKFLDDDDGQ
ncbi:MAG: hypothetical protein GX984_06405 [Erysipelothrix sp.]|nr:hypothetical protein [Erysipelothrix sp.]